SLLEHSHPFLQLREAIAVGAPFVLVPAGADAGIQTSVAGDVNRRGDLGVERGVAIPVAADHLADAHPLRVPDQCGRDRPALEGRLGLRFRHGVKMIVDPDAVPPAFVRHLRYSGHRFILLYWTLYLRPVNSQTMRVVP